MVIPSVNVSFQARVAHSIPGLIRAHAMNTKAIWDLFFLYSFPITWGLYYIEAINWNYYVKKSPKYCDHSLRINSILETSPWQLKELKER